MLLDLGAKFLLPSLSPEQVQAIYSMAGGETSSLYPGLGQLFYHTPQVVGVMPPPEAIARQLSLAKLAIGQLAPLPKFRYYLDKVILGAPISNAEFKALLRLSITDLNLLPKTQYVAVLTLESI